MEQHPKFTDKYQEDRVEYLRLKGIERGLKYYYKHKEVINEKRKQLLKKKRDGEKAFKEVAEFYRLNFCFT